jgi:hypothetical protein
LSTGGKEVLIKSVAHAILFYSMACFKFLEDSVSILLIRQFWWGSKAGERKPSWVSWEEMTKPKCMGA